MGIVGKNTALKAWDAFRYHMQPVDTVELPDGFPDWPPPPELITRVWRKMATRLHPDAGGATEVFQQASAAKDLLLDYLTQTPPSPAAKMQLCPACNGHGAQITTSNRIGGRGLRRRCPECGGTGRLP